VPSFALRRVILPQGTNMMKTKVRLDNNTQAFFELVRAGLWEKEVRIEKYGIIDYGAIFQLATEQSIVGLVACGLEYVADVNVPHELALQFVGQTLQIEQRNKTMNEFVVKLINILQKAGVSTLLVKGQGIAQCYERPLWRSCGDVDLFINEDNYRSAAALLTLMATSIDEYIPETKHLSMIIDGWKVELHGSLRSQLGKRIDSVIDEVQEDTFSFGNMRVWEENGVPIFLPSPDNDIIFIFCHILQHFFREGIGLRQICDLCRLLWTFRETINIRLLENRLRKAALVSEWRAFAELLVTYLGMSSEAMPLYHSTVISRWRAKQILKRIINTGNFGHNNDNSNIVKSFYKRKMASLWRYTRDALSTFMVFPLDSFRGLRTSVMAGLKRTFGK